MAEVAVLTIHDDSESWVQGLYATEDDASREFRAYLVDRFGEAAVAEAEASENGLDALMAHKVESFEAP